MKKNKKETAQEVQAQEQLKVKVGISNLNEFTVLVNQTIENLNKIKDFKFEITQIGKVTTTYQSPLKFYQGPQKPF